MSHCSRSVGRATLAATVMIAAGTPAVAQIALRSERAAAAMPERYSDPLCRLEGQHYKTSDAQARLHEALATSDPDRRARALEQGRESQLEGILKDRQNKSSTAWYTLAQIYLYQGDLVGADSALRYTQAVSPKCAESIEALRTRLWVPLITAAAQFARSGAADSGLALFQQAAAIFPEKPQGMLNAGVLFANRGETDSAISWFERAAAAAARGDFPQERNQATYNLAAMLQRAERHAEAAAALEKYLTWVPDDENAKRALAASYRATGRTEKARALEGQVGASDDATSEDAIRVAVNLYEEKRYAQAVEAFERVRAASPHNRDALLGLAACYQALANGPKLVESARGLLELEPLSADALRLLGAGYKLTKQPERAVEVAQQLVGLVTAVAVDQFTTSADSAMLTGTALGRAGETVAGRPVAPAAMELVVEFIAVTGGVVASEVVLVPALRPGATASIVAQGHGKGIVAWRYRRKVAEPVTAE